MIRKFRKERTNVKTLYGYTRHDTGAITINQEHATVVNLIYDLYLQGKSLGGIASELKERSIPSPTGKSAWGRAAVDDILSKGKYVPLIISEEKFYEAQFEKARRTNTNDNKTRKTARYSSQNVLSGLLICGECGRNYRRITRPSGEVVWRCADRVENGKRAVCSNMVTVSDDEIREMICERLNLEAFDETAVGDAIETVEISGERIVLQMKPSMEFGSMAL